MEPYLYISGLKKLVSEIRGDEVIHIGIRPYGFHAGNIMAFVVYPYLLCKHLEDVGKTPRLQFIISINDWEQDALDGPDYRKYPFNIYPKNTSIQFTPDEEGCCKTVVDHWQPIIEENVNRMKKRFPEITFKFVRNSELRDHPYFKEFLIETLKDPQTQIEIFKKYSGKETLDAPIQYASAVCPNCKRTQGKTTVVENDRIHWECSNCNTNMTGDFTDFQYWWYHKPLLLARIKVFKMDILLSGGDYFGEGDYGIRRAFIQKYAPEVTEPKMLFAPMVIAFDGTKMSKSRGNTNHGNIKKLILAAAECDQDNFYITNDLILDKRDEKDYSSIF
jgi:lysyl-tRNA synthetase class I